MRGGVGPPNTRHVVLPTSIARGSSSPPGAGEICDGFDSIVTQRALRARGGYWVEGRIAECPRLQQIGRIESRGALPDYSCLRSQFACLRTGLGFATIDADATLCIRTACLKRPSPFSHPFAQEFGLARPHMRWAPGAASDPDRRAPGSHAIDAQRCVNASAPQTPPGASQVSIGGMSCL